MSHVIVLPAHRQVHFERKTERRADAARASAATADFSAARSFAATSSGRSLGHDEVFQRCAPRRWCSRKCLRASRRSTLRCSENERARTRSCFAIRLPRAKPCTKRPSATFASRPCSSTFCTSSSDPMLRTARCALSTSNVGLPEAAKPSEACSRAVAAHRDAENEVTRSAYASALETWSNTVTGIEHLWRELSHIFAADPSAHANLPQLAVQHLDGFPLELMDGGRWHGQRQVDPRHPPLSGRHAFTRCPGVCALDSRVSSRRASRRCSTACLASASGRALAAARAV